MDNKEDVPKWKNNDIYLNLHKNIILEYGQDKTGNLYSKKNLQYIYSNYKHSVDFVTGDGGIDYSNDFNKQEESSLNLILPKFFTQCVFKKKGGSFVLKLFDTFTSLSVELLFFI